MHIYIDESGQFIPLGGAKAKASAVVALVVPSAARVALGRAFRKLKRVFRPQEEEIKGSSMSEREAAAIASLLHGFGAIVEAVAINVGEHSAADVSRFKTGQAEKLTEHITREHKPGLILDVLNFQKAMSALSDQLFLQVFCLWQLIPRVLETATMYHSQRRPRELGSFVWRVDAKDRDVTAMEDVWTSLIGPLISSKSQTQPMRMIPGGDYSYYERYDAARPDDVPPSAERHFTDLKLVLRKDFRFVPSTNDLGLQLADIVAAAITRALNGTLKESGWKPFGALLVQHAEQTLGHIALTMERQPQTRDVTNPTWASVIRHLESQAQPMLTSRTMRLIKETGG